MQAKRLWVGLVLAVAAPAAAQPAEPPPAAGAPATPKPAPKARKAPKAPKAPKKGAKAKVAEISPADVAALSGANLEAAAKAAVVLGTLDVPAAHDALLDALALGLPAAVAVPAIASIAMHPAPPDVIGLKRYAKHQNPTVRSAAIGALANYPNPEAHAVIVAGLHDPVGLVRGASASAAARGRVRTAIDALFLLLAKGEDASAKALAALADAELAVRIANQLGKVPDATLAVSLGAILKRADFPEGAKVEIVRAIAKIQDATAVSVLTDYIDATPKSPPRTSRQEAVMVVEARLGGGKK